MGVWGKEEPFSKGSSFPHGLLPINIFELNGLACGIGGEGGFHDGHHAHELAVGDDLGFDFYLSSSILSLFIYKNYGL